MILCTTIMVKSMWYRQKIPLKVTQAVNFAHQQYKT